ncbi:MAG: trypsin-like serine protease [Beijerinckiaceae bacterium]
MIRRSIPLAIAALSLAASSGARAIVGPSSDGAAYAGQVLMVLAQAPGSAGFCSGVVVAPNIVLTAAHCVAAPTATRVHFRDSSGAPVLLTVARVARHPEYRADAVAARAKSVDLALVETSEPLPSSFAAISLGEAPGTVGAVFKVAGFGMTRQGEASSSGHLRSALLTLREPLSKVLLWLEGGGAGACTGDSGGPVFYGGAIVGIVAYAQAAVGRGCGGLTQAVRVAPYADWIVQTIRGWR